MGKKRYLSVKETANLLNLSEETVRNYCKEGKLPFQKVKNQHLIPQVELGKWLVENGFLIKHPVWDDLVFKIETTSLSFNDKSSFFYVYASEDEGFFFEVRVLPNIKGKIGLVEMLSAVKDGINTGIRESYLIIFSESGVNFEPIVKDNFFSGTNYSINEDFPPGDDFFQ